MKSKKYKEIYLKTILNTLLAGTSVDLPPNSLTLDLALLLSSSQVTEAHLVQILRPGNPFTGKNASLLTRDQLQPL